MIAIYHEEIRLNIYIKINKLKIFNNRKLVSKLIIKKEKVNSTSSIHSSTSANIRNTIKNGSKN